MSPLLPPPVSLLAATAAFSRASDFDALAASSFHPTPLLCLARKRATAGRRAWSQRCTTPMKTMLSPLPPWRPRAANLRPRWRQRHRSRSSHRTRRPEHSVCDARRTAPRVANTLVGNGAAHHPLPRLRNAHARNGTLQTQQRSPLSLTRWHTLKFYGYLLLLLLHRLAAPATAHTHTRHTSCCIIGTTSA